MSQGTARVLMAGWHFSAVFREEKSFLLVFSDAIVASNLNLVGLQLRFWPTSLK